MKIIIRLHNNVIFIFVKNKNSACNTLFNKWNILLFLKYIKQYLWHG